MAVYKVDDYARMAADWNRTEPYLAALRETVKPGSVVLEIGTGIGLFAIAAARLGARRVYAVEMNDAVLLGEDLARAAGVHDRITFHHGSVLDLPVPEPVDVVFFDLRGASPLFGDAFITAKKSIERWLRPGGVFFPTRDTLYAAVVRAPFVHEKIERLSHATEPFGVPSELMRNNLVNTLTSDSPAVPVTADDVLSEPFAWAKLSYGEAPPARVAATQTLRIVKGGVGNGIALWFRAELTATTGYDSAPGMPGVYARVILPFERQLSLAEGETVNLTLTAFSNGAEWGWDTAHLDANGKERSRMRQSTFLSRPFSRAAQRLAAPGSAPTLSRQGKRIAAFLNAMDGSHTLETIAHRESVDGTPEDVAATLRELSQLALRYGE
jgi:SAM-dependent methyltransferase